FSSRRRHTISDRDWSSDVCSSDLVLEVQALQPARVGEQVRQDGLPPLRGIGEPGGRRQSQLAYVCAAGQGSQHVAVAEKQRIEQIGRASCRERVQRQVVTGVGEEK